MREATWDIGRKHVPEEPVLSHHAWEWIGLFSLASMLTSCGCAGKMPTAYNRQIHLNLTFHYLPAYNIVSVVVTRMYRRPLQGCA